jgi:hypothetical protein
LGYFGLVHKFTQFTSDSMRKSRFPVVIKFSLIFLALGSICLSLISAGSYQIGENGYETNRVPADFELLMSSLGAALYEKQYPGGYPDFVQVIDLHQGAQLALLYGGLQDLRNGKGVFGGNDARFTSLTLGQYWNQLSEKYENPFCVTNGQFFYMPEYPTRLPFPLKVEGQILTDGYDNKNFEGQKLILEIWGDRVNIQELTQNTLYSSTAPNIVGGLTEDARKSPDKYVARTFVGIKDQNKDGKYETVLIFNTQTARQEDAAQVLRSFGAARVMMLDGGSSTQLICQKFSYISTDRLVPQAIGVVAGSVPRVMRAEHNPLQTISENGPVATLPIQNTIQNEKPTLTTEKTKPARKATETQTSTITATQPITTAMPLEDQDDATNPPAQTELRLGDVIWIPIVIIILAPLIFLIVQDKRKR